jgi:ABC-type polysaccharide/polyol phosphate transport system ATPase subunit
MNKTAAVEFQGVWKNFHRHVGRVLLRTQLRHLLAGRAHTEQFHALKNLTFRLDPGESLAVIGSNGAGKSTLLSMVAGLANPDEGTVVVRGRIAPLLGLGSGFHVDLTGAENLTLNAALLGISRKRLDEVLGDIVDFAELGDFMDEPLRTYSSGMILRLAFSVAAHMDPDILLIDEVLAVGDAVFQEKCFDRILDFRRKGKTILCVSHAAGMVQRLCSRAIWIDHGELILDGPIAEVSDAYAGRPQTRLE